MLHVMNRGPPLDLDLEVEKGECTSNTIFDERERSIGLDLQGRHLNLAVEPCSPFVHMFFFELQRPGHETAAATPEENGTYSH